ncbi:MAG: hypothetical protein L6Q37_01225 [Bdellovibrionaceae bacterium]|nr:hypothetical protein [Pseudobdellovibrionaceae bacterium]
MLSRKRFATIFLYTLILISVLIFTFLLMRNLVIIYPTISKCEIIENLQLLKIKKNIDFINSQSNEVKYFISRDAIISLNNKINDTINFQKKYCNQSKNFLFTYMLELNKKIIFFEEPLNIANFTTNQIYDILKKTLTLIKKIPSAKKTEENWKKDLVNYCSLLSEKEKLFHYFSVNTCRSPSNVNNKDLCFNGKNKQKDIFYTIDKNIENNSLLMAKKWLHLWKEKYKYDLCK